MAVGTYGRGKMLGEGVDPRMFVQDFSGFTRAAEIQAQGMQNLGANIGGIIKDFGEAKKEQKKVDAYNKASAKAIEAAITLGDSYGITGAEETLRPFLDSINDPSLSPIQKAALLDEGKAMIPNVFGRFDQSQANAAKMAELNARFAPKLPESPTPTGAPFFVPDPGGKTETQYQRMSDGRVIPVADLISGAMDYGMRQGDPLPTNAYLEQIDSGAFDQEGDVDPMADEVPATGVGGGPGVLNELPLGTRPIKGDQEPVIITQEKLAELMAVGVRPKGTLNPNGTFSVTDFNTASLPPGMTIEYDKDGGFKMVQGPGVGGRKEQAQVDALTRQVTQASGSILRDANELIPMIQTTNPRSRVLASKPGADLALAGTSSYNTSKLIDSLKASISIDNIINLRQTGTTLGQIPVKQQQMMSELLGSLDPGLSNEVLIPKIQDLISIYGEILDETYRALPADSQKLLTPIMRELNNFRKSLGQSNNQKPRSVVDPLSGPSIEELRAQFQEIQQRQR